MARLDCPAVKSGMASGKLEPLNPNLGREIEVALSPVTALLC